MERFGLRYGPPIKPRWWLGEKLLREIEHANHRARSTDVD